MRPDTERRSAVPGAGLREPTGLSVALLLALLAALALAAASGRYPMSLSQLATALWSGLSGGDGGTVETVVWQVRLPRVLAAALAGAALAMSGAGMQAVFRNALAAPDLLGVSAGAALGAVVGILLGWPTPAIQVAAFLGGVGSVLLVWVAARQLQGADRILTLILCGVAVGSLLSAGVAFAKYVADPAGTLPAITFWLLGSFAGVTPSDALALALTTGIAGAVLAALGWRVDLLLLSDDEVRTSGVRAGGLRALVIVACTLAASGAVAIAGVIGWIGLVVPHAVRLAIGGGFARALLPTSLAGALLMLVVDTVARGSLEAELPPGVLMALVGAPALFALLALRSPR